jgi:predicted metal-dependent phosphoesterase TrpH
MHTTASDGLASIEQVLDFVAQRRHLDVIAITDHDRVESSLRAWEQRTAYPFDIVPGVEVTTREGHVLGWWVTRPVPRDLSLIETVAAIHEQGGLAALAHPFHFHIADSRRQLWMYLTDTDYLRKCSFDAIEGYNAGVVTPFSNKLASRLARLLGVAVVGNSDAHTLGAIGSGATRFAGRSERELRTALKAQATVAEGHPWTLSDYLEIARNLHHWIGNPKPVETKPLLSKSKSLGGSR